MHLAALLLFGFLALFWLSCGLQAALGAMRLPWLKNFASSPDAACPSISLLFAARNEQEKLPAALATLMEIDYPNLEIIAVDDRSTDETGRILDEFASGHSRFRAVHVSELPPRWLGKTHALQKAYEESSGEWLLFTDADVRFLPDTLRRAISLAQAGQYDHLTLVCDIEMTGFWEKAAVTFFGLGFHLLVKPHRAGDPRSGSYVGIGAFQLVRRSAYEASGTHQRLALEVVDDMKLGKILKQTGFRSGAAVAQDYVLVRWHAGFGNMARGVTKNFFAAAQYSLIHVGAQLAALAFLDILPWMALPFLRGWALLLAIVAVCIPLGFHAAVARVMRVSPLYALTHPLGAAIFIYMLSRSTILTLWRNGIVWRDTFYPLDMLRKGTM